MSRPQAGMSRGVVTAALCALALAGPGTAQTPAATEVDRPDVPVRVRLIKGSRQGPARYDPKLNDLHRQLSRLAYVRWDQVNERNFSMATGRTEFVELPGGEHVGLTLQQVRGQTVTFDVSLASRNTESRLTVEKGQRIVHQVTGEKEGAAFFVTVTAWPR